MLCKEIILADNQFISCLGWRNILELSGYKCKIFQVNSSEELISQLQKQACAIVIIDFSLFDFRDTEQFLIIATRFKDTYWLICDEEINDKLLKGLKYSDVNCGFIEKSDSKELFFAAADHALNNTSFLSDEMAKRLQTISQTSLSCKEVLTSTEKEILVLIAKGMSSKQIAQIRFLSIHTVVTHKKNIFRKLEVNTIYEATRYAIKAGLINPSDYYI